VPSFIFSFNFGSRHVLLDGDYPQSRHIRKIQYHTLEGEFLFDKGGIFLIEPRDALG
jgi:hypothetical protein